MNLPSEHTQSAIDSPTDLSKITAIYIVGPSCTGKTTLCTALAQHLDVGPPAYITEVARTVMKEQGFSRKDVHTIEMQEAIMVAQLHADNLAREAVIRGDLPLLLSDRSAIDPVVYTGIFSSENAGSLMNSPEFQGVLPNYRNATFILLKPVIEWLEDDGVRSLDDLTVCTDAFQDRLRELRIPYRVLDKSCQGLEERVSRVLGWAGATEHSISKKSMPDTAPQI